jgi:hypothetical protein
MASTERTRLLVLVGVLVVVSVWTSIRYFSTGGKPGESSSRSRVEFTAHNLPRLGPLSVDHTAGESQGSQRNPFIYGAPPTPTRNLTPPPTLPPAPTARPIRRKPTPTPCPGCPDRPPPRFEHLYLGTFGPQRLPIAVFRKGEDLEIGFPGFVIQEKFIVREVGLESVVIGFVGYPEEVSTRVPLSEN